MAARALECSDIPFGIYNYSGGNSSRDNDLSWKYKEMDAPNYPVNLFHINADQMPLAYDTLGPQWFSHRYNIGYWHWELPEFPDAYLDGFRHLDEVWVPTTFIQESIADKSPIPVVKIPHGIQVNVPINMDRQSFGLPERRFLFLCMYDTFSYSARKNPYSVLKAYRDAVFRFGLPAGLIIKMNNPQQSEIDNLNRESKGLPNVWIVDRVMSRMEANALLQCADCYISLHRSEGFGLPLAEAMYLGKPVIGTNWSGNTDFMTSDNSGAVQYELTRIGQHLGPYEAHQIWAEPDVEHASHLMMKAVYNDAWRKRIASKGQETIRTSFSPQSVGKTIRQRLINRGIS
ncbi:glycoside hydrolase [Cohnella abietis]|uniref:Glycoside hydrolase n=1 Tax=Cohnella abietis TaxID=2507935 RepID=A0A3T1DDG8_9BACL|nr:glycoside hydrolase [Cohnella abietis]